jgi:O-antigen/teichoic acid export membrane protein
LSSTGCHEFLIHHSALLPKRLADGRAMLIRQTLAYLPAQLLSPLIQFATAIILTHYLVAADYGLTMLVFASQELIFQIFLSWWTTYFLRYAGGFAGEGAQRNLRATEATIILATAAMQIVATLMLVAVIGDAVSSAFVIGACLYVVTRSYLTFLGEKARRETRILAYSILQIGAPLASLALALLMFALFGASPARVLLDFAVMHLLIAALVAWRMGAFSMPGRPDAAILRAALNFGIPVLVSNIFGWFAAQGIRFVVQYGLGAAALGLLSVGWGLAIRIAGVAAMVVTAAAYPLAVRKMDEGDPDAARRQLSTNSALLLGLIAPATAGVIVIAEPLVTLLIAAEYRAATIAILPWALVCAAIRNLRMHGWDQMYLLFEKPKPLVVVEGLEALVTILAAILGLRLGGLEGAVIGAALAAVVVALADYVYLNRRFGLSAPLGFYLRILAATGIMAAALLMLPALGLQVTASWSGLVLAIAFGALVYTLAAGSLFLQPLRAALSGLSRRGPASAPE